MLQIAVTFAFACTAPAPAVLSTSFGSSHAQLGLIREPESSPEGPGSLAVDAEGRVYVLDAVHQRVAVFDKGSHEASIALPSDTVEDIALLPSGDLVALDRLVDRTVTVIAPNGAVLARAAVQGSGVDDGGEVTAVFADATGVWLEVLHGTQVRVLDAAGHVDDARITRPGLPMQHAGTTEYVRLRKIGDGAQILFFDANGLIVADGATTFSSLLELSGLVVDGDRIFVAGHELVQRTPESKPARDAIVTVELVRLSDRLVERGRHTSRASPEWVPLKQLVSAGPGRVAHLYVDSTARPGVQSVEVTSW